MKLRKKHIGIAIKIIGSALLIFTVFTLIPEEALAWIGENVGVKGFLDIEKVRTWVTGISSGILGSAIVAAIFYKNEYDNEKQQNILEIIRISNEILRIYREIPYLAKQDNDYYRLEKMYYYETLDNQWKRDLNETIDKMIETLPLEMRKEKIEYEKMRKKTDFTVRNQLKIILEEHPELRKRRFDNEYIDTEQKLRDIITEYDMYIDKTMECVKKLQEYDLESLKLMVDKYECIFCYSAKKKKKLLLAFSEEKKEANNIFPYNNKEKISSQMIANRIYEIHNRIINKYTERLNGVNDISKSLDRKRALEIFITVQKDLFEIDTKILPVKDINGNVQKEIPMPYAYYRLIMCVDNLQRILFSEISKEFEYMSSDSYARLGESVEYGAKTEVITINGIDAYGDIYRK